MKRNKSLGLSIFFLVLTVVLIAVVIFTVGINYIFGASVRSGRIFGKNIFVMNSDIMEPELSKGSAIIADSNEISVLIEGNVILFSEQKGFENIMRIVEVVHDTDKTVYRVAGDNDQSNVLNVPKENVIAKCTTESPRLGKVITFLKSMTGVILGMIVPCIILLVMLMVKIFSAKRRNKQENEEIVYPETSFGIGSNKNDDRNYSSNPLFDPSMAPKPDADFVMKKSSIAENFSIKAAAKRKPSKPEERNVQTENAVEKFRAAVDEKPSSPISQKATLAPETSMTDKTEKMQAIKEALNNTEDNLELEKQNIGNTFSLNMSSNEDMHSEPDKLDDIINDNDTLEKSPKISEKATSKKQDNIKSIDDLIKALEEEKKKL